MTTGSVSPRRADTRRNHERILAAAAASLADTGEVSFNAIAKQAEVGVGTVYRHFPTPEALILAVYRREVRHIVEVVPLLLEKHAPDEALRLWVTDHVAHYFTYCRENDCSIATIFSNPLHHRSHPTSAQEPLRVVARRPNGIIVRGAKGVSDRGNTAVARAPAGAQEVIPLGEEVLEVGKRTVSRGTARIHRYVVETPAEQQVTLQSERVVIERRRPTGERVNGEILTEVTIEMAETDEVAVVGKRQRLREEIVVRTERTAHVETVRETLRHDEVEIQQPGKQRVQQLRSATTER